jgi:hypothetical protein
MLNGVSTMSPHSYGWCGRLIPFVEPLDVDRATADVTSSNISNNCYPISCGQSTLSCWSQDICWASGLNLCYDVLSGCITQYFEVGEKVVASHDWTPFVFDFL